MKLERTKNASRSAMFGIALKLYQIIIPFIMRTAMIYLMGIEYLGLNSLFSSILQVLNLAELGVGSAMVFSMYKPIAEDDDAKICALEKLYHRYYLAIGAVIAVVGIILTPFVPQLIKGEIPSELNVYILYLLNLGATILSYWLFAYKNSLFQAHQRTDITSKINIVTVTIQYGAQLLVLWVFHSYYLYLIIMLATQMLTNVITAIYANKIYPNYQPKGDLSKEEVREINKRIKDLFTAKLGATVVNSADTIVISAFLGLTVLAMYQNYYFILSAVMGILQVFIGACLSGIGNSIVTETIEKNYEDFKKLVFIVNWMVTICVSCFASMYQPFITLWVGEKYTFEYPVVTLLCIYFYLVIMQQIIGLYKDAAGIWHQDRFRPLIASAVNLVLNLAFVNIWGIYAIIASTLISYIIVAIPWMITNVFKYVFKRSAKEYVTLIVRNMIACTFVTAVTSFFCNIVRVDNLFVKLVINCVICVVSSNFLMWCIYGKTQHFYQMIDYICRLLPQKLVNVTSKMKKGRLK